MKIKTLASKLAFAIFLTVMFAGTASADSLIPSPDFISTTLTTISDLLGGPDKSVYSLITAAPTATHANVQNGLLELDYNPTGSGTRSGSYVNNSPQSADISLNIVMEKKNWNTNSAVQGEMDPIYLHVFNGGSSDSMLVGGDVQHNSLIDPTSGYHTSAIMFSEIHNLMFRDSIMDYPIYQVNTFINSITDVDDPQGGYPNGTSSGFLAQAQKGRNGDAFYAFSQPASDGTGTISSSGTNITGSGTNFLSILHRGDVIEVGWQRATVDTVTDNTHATVFPAFNPAAGNSTFKYGSTSWDHVLTTAGHFMSGIDLSGATYQGMAMYMPVNNGIAWGNVTLTSDGTNLKLNNNNMVASYPGAGIPKSTGGSWDTSYSTSGSGNIALTTAPSFVTPDIGAASGTSLNLSGGLTVGSGIFNTSGVTTPNKTFTFPNRSLTIDNITTSTTTNIPSGFITSNGTTISTIASGTMTNGKVCTYSSTGPTISCNADDVTGANANGYYLVNRSTNAPANAINLGALSTGLLKATVSSGVATISSDTTSYAPLNSPAFTTPNIGVATGTSLTLTGTIDGLIRESVNPTSPVTVTGNSGHYYNYNNSTGITYNLPTNAEGKRFCFDNIVTYTSKITLQLPANTYADCNGVASGLGKTVVMGGALGDKLCAEGVNPTYWMIDCKHGTCTCTP